MDVGGLVDRCRQVGKTGWLVSRWVKAVRWLDGGGRWVDEWR